MIRFYRDFNVPFGGWAAVMWPAGADPEVDGGLVFATRTTLADLLADVEAHPAAAGLPRTAKLPQELPADYREALRIIGLAAALFRLDHVVRRPEDARRVRDAIVATADTGAEPGSISPLLIRCEWRRGARLLSQISSLDGLARAALEISVHRHPSVDARVAARNAFAGLLQGEQEDRSYLDRSPTLMGS